MGAECVLHINCVILGYIFRRIPICNIYGRKSEREEFRKVEINEKPDFFFIPRILNYQTRPMCGVFNMRDDSKSTLFDVSTKMQVLENFLASVNTVSTEEFHVMSDGCLYNISTKITVLLRKVLKPSYTPIWLAILRRTAVKLI